jgi:hypothetical protein
MIPTTYKAKLGKHLSYPIGAEALTEGLAAAPHAESFGMSFWGKPAYQASPFQSAAARQPCTVLVAEYRPARKPGYGGANFMVESGWYDEKWEVTVYPVVRELRHLANRLIRERGLPLVVEWLRSSKRAGWLSRSQRLELMFNPTEESLSVQEVSAA